MRTVRSFHPLLLAVYPVLALYATNSTLLPASEVWRPMGVLLAGTAVFWLAAHLVLRDVCRSSVLTSLALIALMSFGHVYPQLSDQFKNQKLLEWWIVWTIASVPLVWKLARALNRLLNAASVVLLAFALFSIGQKHLRANALAGRVGIPGSSVHIDLATAPDILYVILDGYGSADALRRAFRFDNRPFIDELKKRGFAVPEGSLTNYCQTELSLASSLNLDYIQSIFKGNYPDSDDRSPLDRIIVDSRLRRELERQGYAFQVVTTGFPGFEFGEANIEKQLKPGLTLTETALLHLSALPDEVAAIEHGHLVRGRMLENAMAALGRQGKRTSKPRFTFAHILMPHPPFVLDAEGNPIRQKGTAWGFYDGSHYMAMGGTPQMYADGYVGQVECLNKMVLDFIDRVLRESKIRPIIVIQGDHGSKSRLDQESLAKTDLWECMPILNAYLLPPDMEKDLYDGISPVNTWRIVLRHLLGQNLPNLADRSYYAPWSNPYRLTDVTDRLRPAGRVQPPSE